MDACRKREIICVRLTNYTKSKRPFQNLLRVEPITDAQGNSFLCTTIQEAMASDVKDVVSKEGLACAALAGLSHSSDLTSLASPSSRGKQSQEGCSEHGATTAGITVTKSTKKFQHRNQWKKHGVPFTFAFVLFVCTTIAL